MRRASPVRRRVGVADQGDYFCEPASSSLVRACFSRSFLPSPLRLFVALLVTVFGVPLLFFLQKPRTSTPPPAPAALSASLLDLDLDLSQAYAQLLLAETLVKSSSAQLLALQRDAPPPQLTSSLQLFARRGVLLEDLAAEVIRAADVLREAGEGLKRQAGVYGGR